ncbi:putative ribonuclease H-like domain-containing protein [Tanacetum coccineum]
MRPFGYPVTILNTIDHLGKFDGKADERFFVGYSTNSKASRVFNSRTRIVEENLHVQFSKNTPNIAGSGPNWLFDIDALTKSMDYKPVVARNQSNSNAGTKACNDVDSKSSSDAGFKPSGEEEKKDAEDPGNEGSEVPINAVDPKSSIELLNDPNMPELEDIVYSDDDEDVGDELYIQITKGFGPDGFNQMAKGPIGTKWVTGTGSDERVIVIKNKARLVRKIYPNREIQSRKALYGLHQAPKAWYETFATYLLDNGFQKGKIDKTLFIRRVKSDILLVQVYVDDIIFGSTKKSLCIEFEKMMHKKFQMSSIGELTFFLGLQVKQKEDGIFISQDKYMIEILKKFGFNDVKTTSTPIETHNTLVKDADGKDVDEHLYRFMIGSLMYLTSSRPDIMFVVCACARYQVNPKVSHLHAVKKIFRYLKGQPKLGLWYPKDSPFDLVAYTDSDYARASLDRKSTT